MRATIYGYRGEDSKKINSYSVALNYFNRGCIVKTDVEIPEFLNPKLAWRYPEYEEYIINDKGDIYYLDGLLCVQSSGYAPAIDLRTSHKRYALKVYGEKLIGG